MKILLAPFKWLWSIKGVIFLTLASAVLFFAVLFPFSDLSMAFTTQLAQVTHNNVYLQFEDMDVSLFPSPGITGKGVTLETGNYPAIEASWVKVGPSWLNLIGNAWTIKKAAGGDPEAVEKLSSRISINASAEGLMGGDVDLKFGPGTKTDASPERSAVELNVENINLADLQKWADLSFKLKGQASVQTQVQFTPGMAEQPEGEYDLNIKKFEMPATTIQIPMGEANMPVALPTLTLSNVELKGRLSNGQFLVESGRFGSPQDPLSGKIRGNMMLSFENRGGTVAPILGRYDLSVELNTNGALQKSLGFAFLILDNAKTPTSGGGAKYVFRAMGAPMGVPSITRLSTF